MLSLARITADKGPDIAARVCSAAGVPLVLAGPVAGIDDPTELERRLAAGDQRLAAHPDVRFFQAFADPTRLAIVRELAGAPEVCACDFTSCCDVRQPTVSHHLKILAESGLVTREQRGRWAYYRVVPEVLRSLAAALGPGGAGPR